MKSILCVLLFAVSTSLFIRGADWPEYQGAGRQNRWTEDGTISDFAGGPPKRLWSAPVAAGYAGPTVANEKVYVLDYAAKDREERVVCVHANSGKEIWRYTYPTVYSDIGYAYGPRAAVTIADGLAYSFGMMGNLNCLNANDGTIIWSRNLDKEISINMPIWGLTSSPLVEGDAVIVLPSAAKAGACVMAFQRKTGKELWRAFNEKAGYVSPIMIEQGGKRVLVVWTGYRIAGMDPASGKVYWEIPTKPNKMPINVPAPAVNKKGDKMFLSVFYDGSKLIELDQTQPAAKLLWARQGINERKTDALHCMISPPFIKGDHIFGIDSYGQFRCLEMGKGDRIWEDHRATLPGRWSTVFSVQQGEKTWMLNEAGELLIAEVSPAGYNEIGRVKIIEPTTPLKQRRSGVVLWSPPAFAMKSVFVKNDRELIRIDLAKPPKAN